MKYKFSDMKSGLHISEYGAVEIVYDVECIRQSIRNIFSTVSLERVRNPIGSTLLRLLFQPMNDSTARRIRNEMVNVIERWEPRVQVLDFQIIPDIDSHTYDVSVLYEIAELGRRDTYRTRMRSFV